VTREIVVCDNWVKFPIATVPLYSGQTRKTIDHEKPITGE